MTNKTSGLLIDIGGTKCAMQHSSEASLLESFATESFESPNAIMDHLKKLALDWQKDVPIDFVAVSFGGPFDFEKQRVKRSVHVSGWEEFSFSEWANQNLGVPAIADNDANVGALGEFSTRQGVRSLAYVTISTGIGSGLIFDGKPYRGAKNLAGELGHTVINSSGPEDDRGVRGTLERYCSGYWLRRDYGKTARELLAEDGFMSEYAERLAVGLSNLVLLVNPEVLVLGGGITQAGERLLVALEKNMSVLLSDSGTAMEISTLGSANVLVGARELAKIELRT